MKSRDGKSQRREEKKKEDQERESLRRKKIQVREKVRKSRNIVFFRFSNDLWLGGSKSRLANGSERLKNRLAKAAGAEPSGQMRDEKARRCGTTQISKTPQLRSTFGGLHDEKVQAIVARSTFRSQNVQSTPFSDHFWKLRF